MQLTSIEFVNEHDCLNIDKTAGNGMCTDIRTHLYVHFCLYYYFLFY